MSSNSDSDNSGTNKDFEDLRWVISVSSIHLAQDHQWNHNCLVWNDHVEQLLHENKFNSKYCMSLPAFKSLVKMLESKLMCYHFNSLGVSPIKVRHIVAVGLQGLCGGCICDLRHLTKSLQAAAYQAFNDFINAVNSSPELAITFPQMPAEWIVVNNGFCAKSSDGIMQGYIGAVDGYFQHTQTLSVK